MDRRGFFELDHNRGATGDKFAAFRHVVGTLDEGKGDPISVMIERKGKIGAVFFGDSRHWQHSVWDIYPLAVRERPADPAQGLGKLGAATLGLEPHLAVVEQQLGARLQRRENFGMGQWCARLIAGARIEVEA